MTSRCQMLSCPKANDKAASGPKPQAAASGAALGRRALGTVMGAVIAALAMALAGCPNPDGSYDEFSDRYDELFPPTDHGGGACAKGPAKVGEVAGNYLLSLSAKVSAKNPVLF